LFEFNLFEFQSDNSIAKLADLIKNISIEEGQFETWNLKRILNDFQTQPEKTVLNINKVYRFYSGVHQENGKKIMNLESPTPAGDFHF